MFNVYVSGLIFLNLNLPFPLVRSVFSNWYFDEYKVNLLAQIPLVERSEEQELYEIDYIKETFEKLTDEVVLLLKKERSNKIDSIPQTTVTK